MIFPTQLSLRNNQNHPDKGTALLELAICLPFLFTVIAGTINICNLLRTVDLAHDTVRYAAGDVFAQLGTGLSCQQVVDNVIDDTKLYIRVVMSPAEQNLWEVPKVELKTKTWGNTSVDPGITIRYVTASLKTVKQDNCIFCFGNIVNFIDYTAKVSYALPDNASYECSP